MKKGSVNPSVDNPHYPMDDDARMRFKTQSLLQDYEELVKDNEKMKKRIMKGRQEISILRAQVKFLRRKYRDVMKNPPQYTHYQLDYQTQGTGSYTLKQHSQSTPPLFAAQPQKPDTTTEFHLKEKEWRGIPSSSVVLDLNKTMLPSSEDAGLRDAKQNGRIKKASDGYSPETGATTGILKRLVCRNVGNGTSRSGKRKVSWQDQVALWV